MTLAFGIDGGGSAVRALLVDGQGRELARAETPGAVVVEGEPEAAARAVAAAARAAAEGAGRPLPASVLWAGLAGAGREEARRAVREALERQGVAERVHVGSDVEMTFHAAFPERPGILLIAGTGSIAWARNARREQVRAGGWGRLLGDEGSGYAIGLAALRAVARAEDGRGPATSLRDGVLGALRLESADALIPWGSSATKADVARLVPLAVEAAARGDEAAAAILAAAVSDLEAHVLAVLERGGPWPLPPQVVLWGGLLAAPGGPLGAPLRERLTAHRVTVWDTPVDPALAAARLALWSLAGAAASAP